MTNGSMMDMLDMAQDNWTEMLLQRVERGLAGGKDKIDFQLTRAILAKCVSALSCRMSGLMFIFKPKPVRRTVAKRRRSTIGTDDGCIWLKLAI